MQVKGFYKNTKFRMEAVPGQVAHHGERVLDVISIYHGSDAWDWEG